MKRFLINIFLMLFFGAIFSTQGNRTFAQVTDSIGIISNTQQADKIDSTMVNVSNVDTTRIETLADTNAIVAVDSTKKRVSKVLPIGVKELEVPNFNGIITPSKIIWSLVFVFIGFLVVRVLSVILNRIGARSVRYRITMKRIEPILKISAWIFIIFIIIQGIIRPPNAMVVAFFTSISVAVGFAAQDLLKNIFGGLMILFDRPFQIGDKIQVGSEYGEVTGIGLRSTRILTADDSAITVPNSVMMNSSISNSNSGETNCQVVAELYLPITVDTQEVRRIAMESARVSRYIYLNKPIAVVFVNENFAGRSVYKMRLKAYVADLRYEFAFKSDMLEITMKELVKKGILTDSLL